ncbi:DMT family transporter [Anoxynatronum buryatiense]|nr:DMT family transporter [Anoxynatronum buryatiense]
MLSEENKGYLMVAAASVLWGTMGVNAQFLYDRGLAASHIVFWKLAFAFLITAVWMIFRQPGLMVISRRGLLITMFMGFYGQACYNVFIFNAIEYTGVATATILLYTSPAFVILMSRLLFKELLTPLKLTALVLCTVGTVVTVTEGRLDLLEINRYGVMMGLLAGFTFAVNTVAVKHLTRRYNRWTLGLYFFGFGALFAIPLSDPLGVFAVNPEPVVWLGLFLQGLLPTAMGYGLYIRAFSHGIEASRAGILTTLEIIVAVGAAALLLGDRLGGMKLLGIIMVFSSVVMVQPNQALWSRWKRPAA